MVPNKAFMVYVYTKKTCKTNETYILQQLKKLKS